MVILLIVGAGAVVGSIVAAVARRWPISAPRVTPEVASKGVEEHEKLRHHLRRHFDPKTETGVALIVATLVAVVGMVGVGVLLAMVRERVGLASLDLRLANFGARHASSWSTSVMKWISRFGSTGGILPLVLLATAFEYWRRPSKTMLAFMTVAVGGQFLLSNGIKMLVERARPDIRPLTTFAGTSFPSGHSTASAASLAAIALIMTRGRSRRTKITAASVAAGLAVMVAGTRVFLGVHWFTDVTAGLCLGWGWFALSSIAFGGRLLDFGQPVKAAEDAAEASGSVPVGATRS